MTTDLRGLGRRGVRYGKQRLKQSALYPLARHLYRRAARSARQERTRMRRFYSQFVSSGDLCFDIGANVGQTVEALRACGARVVAVEPNASCRPVLDWQFDGDDDVTLVSAAVGAARGRAVLHYEGTASTASLRRDWPFGNTHAQPVDVVTLDMLLADHGVPTLLNVDVEGVEVEVFRGLSRPVRITCFEARRTEPERARQVLARLASLGRIEGVNMVRWEDYDQWLLDRWLSVEEVCDRLDVLLPRLTDIVVRTSV